MPIPAETEFPKLVSVNTRKAPQQPSTPHAKQAGAFCVSGPLRHFELQSDLSVLCQQTGSTFSLCRSTPLQQLLYFHRWSARRTPQTRTAGDRPDPGRVAAMTGCAPAGRFTPIVTIITQARFTQILPMKRLESAQTQPARDRPCSGPSARNQ